MANNKIYTQCSSNITFLHTTQKYTHILTRTHTLFISLFCPCTCRHVPTFVTYQVIFYTRYAVSMAASSKLSVLVLVHFFSLFITALAALLLLLLFFRSHQILGNLNIFLRMSESFSSHTINSYACLLFFLFFAYFDFYQKMARGKQYLGSHLTQNFLNPCTKKHKPLLKVWSKNKRNFYARNRNYFFFLFRILSDEDVDSYCLL